MAGRTSKTITAGRAEKLFTNTGVSPVVVTINAVSADNTKNPACSIALDTSSTRELNNVVSKHTLSQEVTFTASDFDLLDSSGGGKGTYIVSQSAQSGTGRMGINGTSNTGVGGRFWNVDPYYLENPKAYGKDLGKACGAILVSGNDWRFFRDLNADRQYLNDWLNGTWSNPSGNSYIVNQGVSYYSVGSCYDFHSDTFISFATNGYMTGGEMYDFNGTTGVNFRDANRSSDSFYYNWTGGQNPNSYRVQDNKTLDVQADGGIFIMGMHPNKTAQHSGQIGLIWAARHRNGDLDPKGSFKNAEDSIGTETMSTLVFYSQTYHERWDMQSNGLVSWMKYNPSNNTHYLNVQNRTDGDSGIWSFQASEAFTSGSGVRNFTDRVTKETSSFDLTAMTTQPHRIGASLWVCYTANTQTSALYSTDLINWKTAAQLTGQSTALLAAENTTGANFFMKSAERNKLFGVDSGFSSVTQDGVLENGTQMGVFERNGLVLNVGDSIYMENKDLITSVHTTVMFVEV
jgi:hypothetical protein